MSRLARRLGMLSGALAIALIAGCADSVTGPSDEQPAIPTLEGQGGGPQLTEAACAVWSCQINQCQQDPGQYGACCIQAASTEYPATSRPSCEGPPYEDPTPDWCIEGRPRLTCINKPIAPGENVPTCMDKPVSGDITAYY